MKCDDDTFVRMDAVIKEAKKVSRDNSLYIGNMNYYHKPLRYGKWAVTFEVLMQILAWIYTTYLLGYVMDLSISHLYNFVSPCFSVICPVYHIKK